jgi:hypothetical protein
MSELCAKNQRGGARFNFLIVMVVIGGCVLAGYRYIPVAYQAYLFKDFMQHNVDAAVALGHKPTWVHDQLAKGAPEYGVPPDAVIESVQRESRMEVHVQYTLPIEFPGYTYQYEFDHTARSASFLIDK